LVSGGIDLLIDLLSDLNKLKEDFSSLALAVVLAMPSMPSTISEKSVKLKLTRQL
jgi:hypothetical protein